MNPVLVLYPNLSTIDINVSLYWYYGVTFYIEKLIGLGILIFDSDLFLTCFELISTYCSFLSTKLLQLRLDLWISNSDCLAEFCLVPPSAAIGLYSYLTNCFLDSYYYYFYSWTLILWDRDYVAFYNWVTSDLCYYNSIV